MLSRDEVLRIARLARLDLTEAEVAEYQSRLGKVLEHMKELDSLSLKTIDFPKHVPDDALEFRDDFVREWPNKDALMNNAPQRDGNEFLLPTVLEKET